LLGADPFELYDVDPSAPTFTALRFAAGMTLKTLAKTTGISYTSLHRMVRGVTELSPDAVNSLSAALGASPTDILAAVERDR
jgi:transcriptional regulator with XRE-family HTH domain